jgi:ATP-dependent Clp protease ATP-binding subunit ClpA
MNTTDGLRKVLERARQEAIRVQHDYIGTEHLLVALTLEEDGGAAAVLRALGIDMQQVRDTVEMSMRRGKSWAVDLPFSLEAKRVLIFANAEASRFNNELVGTDHLLVGLLREETGPAAEALRELGITLEAVRAETGHLLGVEEAAGANEKDESFTEAWPTVDQLKHSIVTTGVSMTSLSIIADVDIIPPDLLAELIGALDGLHRAWGGAGLEWESGYVGIGAGAGVAL